MDLHNYGYDMLNICLRYHGLGIRKFRTQIHYTIETM